MFCEKCGKKMKHIMRFSRKSNREFYICESCGMKTKEIPLFFSDHETKTEKVKEKT